MAPVACRNLVDQTDERSIVAPSTPQSVGACEVRVADRGPQYAGLSPAIIGKCRTFVVSRSASSRSAVAAIR